jgi:hypothetical protein
LKLKSKHSRGRSFRDRASPLTYPASLNAGQFVNQLNANTGGVLSNAEIISSKKSRRPRCRLGDASKRAEVLRTIAESEALHQKEFNARSC